MGNMEYPGILRRYFATIIDATFILTLVILSGYVFQHESETATSIKVFILLFMFFVYEPLCTSFFCTIGQKITGIRVRNITNQDKISLFKAYIRIITKLFLGIISFFTMPFSKRRRAIHDFIVGSIVINQKTV